VTLTAVHHHASRMLALDVNGSAVALVEAAPGLHYADIRIRGRYDLVLFKNLLDNLTSKNAGQTIFQDVAWLTAAAAATVENPAQGQVRVLVGFDNMKPVAALPLSISNMAVCRVARMLGDPLAQYSDVLALPLSRGLRAITAAIAATPDVDAFVFRRVRDHSHLAALLLDLGAQEISRSLAPYSDLKRFSSYEEFLRSKSKKRRERARLRRRAASTGHLSFEVASDATRARELTELAITLKRRWLRAKSLTSATLTSDRWCRALLDVASSTGGTLKPIISAIHLDDQPAAIEVGFVRGATYYAFLGASDQKFRRWSPTKIVMEETIRWCFEAGIGVYDLLPPDDPYKAEWTNDACGVADWLVARTMKGEFAVRLTECYLRPLAKTVYPSVVNAFNLLVGKARDYSSLASGS
jgi:CelD/BcsL family acetyltransferase involved in cellulose biosynthesis